MKRGKTTRHSQRLLGIWLLRLNLTSTRILIGLNQSRTHRAACILDNGAGSSLKRADVLHQSWMKNFNKSGRPKTRSASGTTLTASGTIKLPLCFGEWSNQVNFGAVRDLAVPALLRAIYIDRFVSSIHKPEWKLSTPLPTGTHSDCTRRQECF